VLGEAPNWRRFTAARLRDAADATALFDAQPARERHAFSAVFAEVTVDPATGEVWVRRLLGMFAIGGVVNPLLARSQVVGGMIMGLGMALHEEGVRDRVTGRQVNADFAGRRHRTLPIRLDRVVEATA
jgi:xanthine dehydrogenase YagR molybdenum-binding subunit